MMEELGKKQSICSSISFPWISYPEKETTAPLWKLKDCFSSFEKANTSYTDKRMESIRLELKDVPPPPHHVSTASSSQPFPLAPLPLPPPCLPTPQLPPDSHKQQPGPQQQEGPGPKVSVCTWCEHYNTVGYGSLGDGSVVCNDSNKGELVSIYMSPGAPKPSISGTIGPQACSTAPFLTLNQNNPSHGSTSEGSNSLYNPEAYNLQLPSCVATSQPLSSHSCSPCCTGLLQTYLNIPLSCSQATLSAPSAPLAAPLSSLPTLPTPIHVSSGGYPCGGHCSCTATETQRALPRGDHPTTTAHLCANSRHLNVNCTICMKGSRYCQECFLKPVNSLLPKPDKLWPVPAHLPSGSAPIPIPMCNGCGTTSDSLLRIPQTSIGNVCHKFGSPESGGPENTPPVGVFWDIENCCVPNGRSAAAVVQRIRSRFFQGHREAEFICVCDISKESKAVIQELNNCQVTVAHINATAKNAADDKLRQSLRRFAETHTAPATVVLVSSDVNFASELSDLRHRHGFQVILVHGIHTSPALLQHAHRHVAFQEITSDLPLRMPTKAQPSFNLLYVHNLPVNCDKSLRNAVKLRLRRLSDNCGGKVLGLSQGTAVLRFGSPEAAERAHKRMENEDVFGRSIRPSFSPRPKDATGPEPLPLPHPQPMPYGQALSAPGYMSGDASYVPSFSFLPLEKPRSPRRLRRAARPCQTPGPQPERPYSPRRGCSGPPGGPSAKPHQELGGVEVKAKMGFQLLEKDCITTLSPHSNSETATLERLPKPGLIGESMFRRRRDSSSPRRASESPAELGDRSSAEFLISTPSAFSKLNLHRSFSPLVLSQGSWSSRSASPCLSSRSSPLLVGPRSPRPDSPADLLQDGPAVQVANLDYRMSRKELQQTLTNTFSRYGRVKCVELSPHTDYQLKATVQMVSMQQAISAVSGLHRYKIGGKRIHVSLGTGGTSKSLTTLGSEIVGILQDAPANCLPLSKFIELYEKRYSRKLAIGDLYRLTELVAVRDQGGSRLVCLLSNGQARQSPLGSSQSKEASSAGSSPVVFEELEYHEPVCRQHSTLREFSEADFDPDSYKIPFVVTSLRALASRVHSLLQSHEGTLPLLSFPECYTAEFGPLDLGDETREGAVSLEHLITCIPSVTVVTSQNGFKVIKWIHNRPPASNSEPWIQHSKSPVGNPQLIQFSREIIDLLKSKPFCMLPISKFIPSYHHHFAKQCRVSDYGYSKLMELLEAVPHVLQILGMGTKRLLTMTHRAQVKRFTQDLLKLLKFQASKQVAIKDFMQAYHWCFSRDWRVIDYGICDLMDLLNEIPDTTITITRQETDLVISVPKRERTVEEMEHTKQFGKEVVDLLRHQPHCRMPFSKFIPTYHHHFGRQCKLTYYGFTKLVDLFEAIPEVLMMLECGEEKVLALTEVERVKALAAQLVKLLRAQRNCSLPVNQLLTEYSKTFGYGLRLRDYDATALPALLAKLCHVVKVVDGAAGREVQLINRKSLRLLTCQLLALLMAQEDELTATGLGVGELSLRYMDAHGVSLNPCEYGFLSLSELLKSLPYLVELYRDDVGQDCTAGRSASSHEGEWVRLTRLYQFARSVRALLHTYHYNQIFLTEFPAAYSKFTGRSLQARAYGYSSMDELLGAIPQVVWIKGHGHKRIIVLKNDMKVRTSSAASDSPQPDESRDSPSASPSSLADSGTSSPGGDLALESELLSLTFPVDLLCGPVPSCLPSPQLHPDPLLLQLSDLIHFEKSPPPPAHSEGNELDAAAPVTIDEESLTVDEQPANAAGSAVPSLPHPSSMKSTASMDSPNRRASRSKIRLAANFSFLPGP